jgi:hypothetical protein
MRLWQRIRRPQRVPAGSRVRAVHLGQCCAEGSGSGPGRPARPRGWEPAASRRAGLAAEMAAPLACPRQLSWAGTPASPAGQAGRPV